MRGRTGLLQNKAAAISISCVRTVRVQGVCFGRTLPFEILGRGLVFVVNVRPYHTPCTRTAGHRISEKSAALFCSSPWFAAGYEDVGLVVFFKWIGYGISLNFIFL